MATLVMPQVEVSLNNQYDFKLLPIKGITDEKQKRLAIRLNCLGNLFYFIRVALQRHRLVEHVHYPLTLLVQQTHIHDVIEWPRDHFKTTIFGEGASMWWATPFNSEDEYAMYALGYAPEFIRWMKKCHDIDTRTLIVSEVIDNAIKIGMRIDHHYKNNDRFRWLFPEILPDTSCVWNAKTMMHKRTKKSPNGEGTYDFLGVGSALQSRHYERVIEDDIFGRDAAHSEKMAEDAIDYHRKLIGAFDSSPELAHELNDEIIVGNRWCFNDLNQWLRDNEPNTYRFTTHDAEGGCCSLHPPGQPIFPEEWTLEKLRKAQSRLGAYDYSCFPSNTPVTMSDLTTKQISQLNIGDKVIGYELAIPGSNRRSKLVVSEIQYINIKKSILMEVMTTANRIFRCTVDHKFWTGRPLSDKTHKQYDTLGVGSYIYSVHDIFNIPSIEQQKAIDWLCGIIDGEGSCHEDNGTILISQSKRINPDVCKKIEEVLNLLGISFGYINSSETYNLHGGRSLKHYLLQYGNFAKRQRFINALWNKPGKVSEWGNSEHQVFNIKILPGIHDVYNIQTTSGNYVANGYATKNCQFRNNPIPEGQGEFQQPWLRFYETAHISVTDQRMKLVHNVYNGQVLPDVMPANLHVEMLCDPAHANRDDNKKEARCRHAIVVVGYQTTPQRFYIFEAWAEACTYHKVVEKLYEFAKKYKLRRAWLETVAAQEYLKLYLDYRSEVEDIDLKIEPLKTDRSPGAKLKRIRGMNTYYQECQVWLRQCHQDFILEYCQFPYSKTFDLLDVFGYVPQTVRPGPSSREIQEWMHNQRVNFEGNRSQVTGY